MGTYPEWKRPLIKALVGEHHEAALEWNAAAALAYDRSYSGRWFDLLADHDHPDEITARDLVAVTMLRVEVPPHTAAWILGPGRDEISSLLEQIPTDRTIWEADEAELEDGAPASELWSRLQSGCWPDDTDSNGVAWVTAAKLLAAKRPHLIPVYDSKVKEYLGVPNGQFWLPLRDQLSTPEERLLISAAVSGGPSADSLGVELSLLRRIDIVLWMRAGGYKSSPLDPPPA